MCPNFTFSDYKISSLILHLLSNDICRLGGVVALVDDVTDLLVGHDEVDAVGGENQERVVRVLQLQILENENWTQVLHIEIPPLKFCFI